MFQVFFLNSIDHILTKKPLIFIMLFVSHLNISVCKDAADDQVDTTHGNAVINCKLVESKLFLSWLP